MVSKLFSIQTLKTVAVALVCLVVAALVAQCSMSSAGAASGKETAATAEVAKLKVNKKGYPRVRVVTGSKRVALLFVQPYSDANEDDLVYQKKNTTEVYSLPMLKPGESVTWHVNAYDPKTGLELLDRVFTWKRPVAETSSMWVTKYTWKKVANPLQACPKGRIYTFALQERKRTSYLTAETLMKLKLKRANGKIIVRRVDLAFGDGDLVWMPRVGKKTKVVKVRVTVSGRGTPPKQIVDFHCLGS